jgi:hypothetical protein
VKISFASGREIPRDTLLNEMAWAWVPGYLETFLDNRNWNEDDDAAKVMNISHV